MSQAWFTFFDMIYSGTVVSYGLIPGVVGAAACFFLPAAARWLVAVLMLLTTLHGVRGCAHEYPLYLLGCAVFAAVCTAGLYARARRSGSSLLRQHPYDVAAFMLGTLILSLFYTTPRM